MLRNYFLINIVLVIMLGLLGIKLYGVVTYSLSVPSEATVEEGQKSKDIDIKFKDRIPNKTSFQVISNKDLFRPSRTSSPAIVPLAPTSGTGTPKLFATIVRGSESVAIIEDPGTKKSKTYRINETVAGYLISEILEDRVVLLSGENKIEIKLRDDKGLKASRSKAMTNRAVQRNKRTRSAPARSAPVRRPPIRRNTR